MSCLKIVPKPYINQDALERLIHGYIYPESVLYGGLSVDPLHAAEQMHLVKDLWNQTTGRQLRHFVLCFDSYESSDISGPEALWVGACGICEYFASEYQIVFGIHHKDYRWHIHFAMNNVSFVTGKRFPEKNTGDYALKRHILTLPLPTNLVEINYH